MLKSLMLLCLVLNLAVADKDIEIEFIEDFQDTELSKKNVIICYLCWNTENKLKLLNKLINSEYTVSILDIQEDLVENIYPFYKQTFIVDLNCNNSFEILQKASKLLLFSSNNNWLLLTENPNIFDEITENLITLDIHQNSNVILAQKLSYNKYILREIYERNNKLVTNFISLWRSTDKFGNFTHRILANERQNLHKKILGASIVILENDTLNHLDDYKFKHIDSIAKVNYVLVKHLIDYMNASLEISAVDTWGYLNKSTNMYTGMIGDIQKNKYEIGGTALFMTIDRVPIIDYLAMTTPTKVRFVFRRPPLSYEQNIFTLPFTIDLWISSIGLVILMIFLLYSTVILEKKIYKQSSESNNSFLDIVTLLFAAISQQGVTTEPRNVSGKIMMMLAFIALMFLFVSYSANIVALLQSSASNINTLEDLLESRLKLGADDTVYNRYYMSTATERVRKAIFDTKIAPVGQIPHFISLDEGVRRIREGFYAFHMELGRGYKIVADTFYESEKCGLQEINFLDVVDAYTAIKKNSSYKEIFTLGLRKLRESGIQNRELEKIYTNKPECHAGGGSFVSVGLLDCYPAFLVLGFGAGIALIFLIFEIGLQKSKRDKRICCKVVKKTLSNQKSLF